MARGIGPPARGEEVTLLDVDSAAIVLGENDAPCLEDGQERAAPRHDLVVGIEKPEALLSGPREHELLEAPREGELLPAGPYRLKAQGEHLLVETVVNQ